MPTVTKGRILKSVAALSILYFAFCPYPANTPMTYNASKEIKGKSPLEAKVENAVLKYNDNVSQDEARSITVSVLRWSKTFKLDPTLVLGVIATESNFQKHAISGAGAFGLMQVLPKWHTDKIKTAKKELGNPEVFDIDTNIYLGSWILKDCQTKYKVVEKSLQCYNGSVGMKTNYHLKVIKAKKEIQSYIRV